MSQDRARSRRFDILRRQTEPVNRLLLPLAVLGGCFVAAATTFANGTMVRDPRGDVKGETVLDVASVRHGHRARLLAHRLTTHRPWRTKLLVNGAQISFYFDTDDDSGLERRLDVGYARGRLAAVMKDAARAARRRRTSRASQSPQRRRAVRPFPVTPRYPALSLVCFRRHAVPAPVPGLRRHGSERRHPDHARARVAAAAADRPAPIAGQGYRRVFADEFETFSRRRWSRSIWYDDPAAAGDIYARNGVLHLVSRRASNYPNVSVTTLRRRHFRRGYFEAGCAGRRGTAPGRLSGYSASRAPPAMFRRPRSTCSRVKEASRGSSTEPSTATARTAAGWRIG